MNVQKSERAGRDEVVKEMERSISDTFEIRKSLRVKYLDANILDLTKIALSLFIERRKHPVGLWKEIDLE